jgi:MFS family permease
MSGRVASWLAWSLSMLCVAMFLAIVALYVLIRSAPQVPSSVSTRFTLTDLLIGVPFLAFPIVGALIASRRPFNPIGWICLAVGFLFLLLGVSEYYSIYGVAKPGSVPFPIGVAWLGNWLWMPAVGLFATYLFMLFPDGRLPSRRWRPLAWLSGAVIVVLSLGFGLAPGPVASLPGKIRNPFGLESFPWLSDAANVGFPLLALCILASVVSLVLCYRRSRDEEREQIKWIAFAASVVGLLFLIGLVISLIYGSKPPSWTRLLDTMTALSYTGVPIAVGFAVLKYRLYDIDVIINRTLVYSSLTAMLALVYFGCVTATQAIFRTLTGQEQQPQLAIDVSTLVIAAVFNPLQRRIQGFIDRRFYRKKYDARKTLEGFSARLRDETNLGALRDELVGVVRETMQPAHVSLWLRPDPPPRGSEGQE